LQDSSNKITADKKTQKRGANDSVNDRALLASEKVHRSWFGVWLHLAWLCGLIFATPLYRPYPRLVLPLLCVGCVGTGLAIVRLLRGRLVTGQSTAQSVDLPGNSRALSDASNVDESRPADGAADIVEPKPVETSSNAPPSRLRFIWLTLVVGLCVWRAISHAAPAWQNRSALAAIADQAVVAAAENCKGEPGLSAQFDFVVYVYGEPGLFFHSPGDRVVVKPIMDLSFARPGSGHSRIPAFVLAGPHAWQSLQFGDQYRELPDDSMIEIAEFPYEVSDFVLLDDHAPSQLSKHRKDVVKLYRVQFR
jgi:dolichyl-phosphate-mannose-protein mannosyltransferase